MSDVHPSWQHEEEVAVPVTVRRSAPVPKPQQTISRRPAAIVGITLVLSIGFAFFRGTESLRGQLAQTETPGLIRITEQGFDPLRIEVEHGQTLTFRNESSLPHTIESDALCSDTGYCLQTKTLLNGDEDTFTITPDMQQGSYRFTSSLMPDMVGEIVITTQAVENFANEFFETPVGVPTPTANQQSLPTNPYTVNGARMHPFDEQGQPVPEAFGDRAPVALSSTRMPLTQPESGPELWIVLAGSIAGILYVTRGMFATTNSRPA